MLLRAESLLAGLFLTLLLIGLAGAEEPPRAGSDLFRVGEMAQAASDLRVAAETAQCIVDEHGGVVRAIAESLATMSREFDPFGYKTAFHTIGQQSVMIQEQREIIQELQLREIERLRGKNRRLTQAIKKLRQREGAGSRSDDGVPASSLFPSRQDTKRILPVE